MKRFPHPNLHLSRVYGLLHGWVIGWDGWLAVEKSVLEGPQPESMRAPSSSRLVHYLLPQVGFICLHMSHSSR